MNNRSLLSVLGIICLVALAWLVSRPAAAAQEAAAKSSNVVILVPSPKPMPVVLKTAEQMLAGQGFSAQKVELVICGEGVQALLKSAKGAELLKQAADKGVKIVACGLSLQQAKIDKADLALGVQTVDNGLIEVIQLQSQGYLSIGL
jgi:intracellular sulfur oxidation DsrE/DsrF family protein